METTSPFVLISPDRSSGSSAFKPSLLTILGQKARAIVASALTISRKRERIIAT